MEKLEVYSLKRFMLKKKVTVKNRGDLLIGFANISEKQIPEAVERLYRILV